VTISADAHLEAVRAEIAAVDVRILGLVNQRIRRVAELRTYKDANGIGFVDRGREAWLADYLKRINGGPLSDAGVHELISFLLTLVKREVARA
jgi:chorismate mutase